MPDDRLVEEGQEKSWLERITHMFNAAPTTKQDVLELLSQAETRAIIDQEAFSMFEGALRVSDMQVREIMVPRPQMVVVNIDASLEEIVGILVASSHSRFPIVGESNDELHGMLLAKDLLPWMLKHVQGEAGDFEVKAVMRDIFIVPESKRLNVLLQEFREQRRHMVAVIDEYGGVAGLVTIEDVLEEIVGEIEDEFDTDEEAQIRDLRDGGYVVQALTPISDFNAHAQTKFTADEFDTIGGLVMGQFERLPEKGECVEIEGRKVDVLRADNRKIHLVRIHPENTES